MDDLHAQLTALAASGLPPRVLRRQLASLPRGAADAAVGLFAVEQGLVDLAYPRLATALQREPRRTDLAIGLARSQAAMGNLDSALQLLTAALQLNPTDHDIGRWTIQLALDAERFPDAARHAGRILKHQPKNRAAWCVTAKVFEALGEPHTAEHAWRTATRLDPSHRWPWFHLGTLLLRTGQFAQAVGALQHAHQAGEPDAHILAIFGTALAHAGHLGPAQTILQQAIETDPNNLSTPVRLAQVYASLTQEDRADALFQSTLDRAPQHPALHVQYANFLIGVGRSDAAERHLLIALKLQPDTPAASLALGRLHTRRGNHALAVEVLGPKVHAEMESVAAICDYARSCIRTHQPERALPIVLARAERRSTPTQAQFLHHTRGELLQALGDFEAAFAAHEQANRHRECDAQPEHVIADFIATGLALQEPAPARDGPGEGIVFIVGMLRSGTSLTEQILASHPQVVPGGELPSLSAVLRPLSGTDRSPGAWARVLAQQSIDEWDALGHAYIADAARRAGTTPRALGPILVTDKQPTNFLMLGAIARILPNARIIHCRRDPLDTCLSCFFQNFGPGHNYTTELSWVGAVYRAYRAQIAWWTEHCGISVHNHDYEAVVYDTEAQIRALLDALQLPFDPACLMFHKNTRDVRTASVDQVRQPIYPSSVSRADPYAPWLGPLRDALGDLDAIPSLDALRPSVLHDTPTH